MMALGNSEFRQTTGHGVSTISAAGRRGRNNFGSSRAAGLILITVCWTVFFLALLVLTLGLMARTRVRLQSLQEEAVRMRLLTRQTVGRAIQLLQQADTWHGAADDAWQKEMTQSADNALSTYAIIDEDRFININTAAADVIKNFSVLLPALEQMSLEAILARRPYNVLPELLLDEQISAEIVFGNPPTGRVGLVDVAGVWGGRRVNINTAPPTVLLLLPGMTQAAVDTIVARRQTQAFVADELLTSDLTTLGIAVPLATALPRYVTVQSRVFRITAQARSRTKPVSAKAVVVYRHAAAGGDMLYYQEQ